MTRKDHPGGSGVPEVPGRRTPGQVSRRQLMKGVAGAAAGVTAGSALASASALADGSNAAGFIRSVDVAIVGAGISGLYAAHLLSKKPRTSFAVIEARGRTGGRILNERIGGGDKAIATGGGVIGGQEQMVPPGVLKKLELPL